MNDTSPSLSVALALCALCGPAAAALVLAVVTPLRRHGGAAAALSILAALCALASAARLCLEQLHGMAKVQVTVPWLMSGGATLAQVGVRIDGISTSMLVVVTVVAACVQVFSVGYLHGEPRADRGRYFALQSLFLSSMNLLVLAPDLLQLFLGWELVGVTSYLLIGYYFRKSSAARAAVKAFWVTKFADMGLLIGLLVLRAHSGAFSWDAQLSGEGANLVTLLLFLAVVGKSAQFPLHVWLPDAMEGPTPVSALLHAATMVAAGVFLIVRAWPLFAHAEMTRALMLNVGALTALLAACMALCQTDIKKVLAYSTCSQLGYMIAALGAGSLLGGFFHLTTHAFFKALLFLSAGSVIHAVHSNELSDMGGLLRRMPLTAAAFIVGALSLAGLPGLAGFFSKDLILEAVGEPGMSPALLALLASAFLTAFYMGRVLLLCFFGRPADKAVHAHEGGPWLLGPLLLLALPALLLGFAGASFGQLYGVAYHFHLGPLGLSASALGLLGLLGSFLVYRRGAAQPAVLGPLERVVRYGPLDRLYLFLFRHVALFLARIIGWFDRYLVDGLMNLSGWAVLSTGGWLRRFQTGVVNDYVLAVVAGSLALVLWGVLQ